MKVIGHKKVGIVVNSRESLIKLSKSDICNKQVSDTVHFSSGIIKKDEEIINVQIVNNAYLKKESVDELLRGSEITYEYDGEDIDGLNNFLSKLKK